MSTSGNARKNDKNKAQGGGAENDSGAAAPQTIDIDTLSLDQLDQLRQQEESRLQALTNRYAALRQAAARLNQAQSSVSELKPNQDGKEVMVPLTESVYVPGKISDPNKLLVELGTGYFVEKSNKDTMSFLDRKLKIVDANSENLTMTIQASRQNVDSLTRAMQGKMMEIRARKEGALHKQSVESGWTMPV